MPVWKKYLGCLLTNEPESPIFVKSDMESGPDMPAGHGRTRKRKV